MAIKANPRQAVVSVTATAVAITSTLILLGAGIPLAPIALIFLSFGFACGAILDFGAASDGLIQDLGNRQKLEDYNRSIEKIWDYAIRSALTSRNPSRSPDSTLYPGEKTRLLLSMPDNLLPHQASWIIGPDPQSPLVVMDLRHCAMLAPRSRVALNFFLDLALQVAFHPSCDFNLTSAIEETLYPLEYFLHEHGTPALRALFDQRSPAIRKALWDKTDRLMAQAGSSTRDRELTNFLCFLAGPPLPRDSSPDSSDDEPV